MQTVVSGAVILGTSIPVIRAEVMGTRRVRRKVQIDEDRIVDTEFVRILIGEWVKGFRGL